MKNISLLLLLVMAWFRSPAQHYWQQEVNYTIAVTLNDRDHTLQGTEKISYRNQSPDTLSFIYFHLWPNAYQHAGTAFARQQRQHKKRNFHFAPDSTRGWIDGLDFRVNGQPVQVEYDARHPDICKLLLHTPLRPGQQAEITTPFRVKLPHTFSRLGHQGQSYQITQWYPKPAVYDRQGWHPLPYLDQGEFYSEYGRFDVRITLPANYTVGATGVLQTAAEQQRLDSLAAQTARQTSFPTQDAAFPPSARQTKTLHYVQDRIHDFAWFADKRFQVLKSEVELPHSKRKVTTWLMFLNKEAASWVKSVKTINEAIYHYSRFIGDYPYEQVTAVDAPLSAGAGMEYPMVTVTDPAALLHEVGHNWFYGILGSHERQHPWMDEGLNSYYEFRIGGLTDRNYSQLGFLVKNPARVKRYHLENIHGSALNLLPYQMSASRGLDQPVSLPAPEYTAANYGNVVYLKTGVLFQYLANYLSQARFDSCMQTYYRRWQFRHPYPADLQQVFEEVSGEKLNWFFHDLLQTTVTLDPALTAFRRAGDSLQVQVSSRGHLAGPVPVASRDAAGRVLEVKWTRPGPPTQTLTFAAPGAAEVVIDPTYMLPELNRRNNLLRPNRLLPRSEPLRLQFLAGIEQSDRQQVYYVPVAGANTYDKTLLGLAFYNSSLIRKKLNYRVMPLYSIGRGELRGSAHLDLSLPSPKVGRLVTLGLQAQQFERYRKLEPSLTVDFSRRKSGAWEQELSAGYTAIAEQNKFFVEGDYVPLAQPLHYQVGWLRYRGKKQDALQGLRTEAVVESLAGEWPGPAGRGQAFAAKLTLEYHRYYALQDKFRVRLFAGHRFGGGDEGPGGYRLGLSHSPDYRKETIFLDRSQVSSSLAAFRRQTDGGDGGFRNYLPVYSRQGLAALNLDADLPVVPLAAYLDLGLAGSNRSLYYGTGFTLSLVKDFVQIYFPLAGSNYGQHIPQNFTQFKNNIRFLLRWQQLNPFGLVTEALK